MARNPGLGDALVKLVEAVPEIDTESSNAQNRDAFEATARAAAECLIRAGPTLGGDGFVLAEANTILAELVALDGWTNQLGPRFE